MNANISVKSNVWINKKSPQSEYPHEAVGAIPGDLMVEFVKSCDKRELAWYLTRRQMDEYLAYRFFLFHGQSGLAFQDRK